ncbi:BirA family biotin operon repressor/biotin-[acetyl-CoA-carboxylase] ligase [Sphingobium sp. B2D3A]|uniref:biotin--[acetyl-CoA-carboxylase] ligase n=1 Tax=unclassified Sphingobium TaxID=2611147 RepID=UPI0022245148|nr:MULTISPECIES: biotin--[acetyl-CoA-carboxylase] ligase [unclassified Sphingobium]MCW2338548.1 BirA family biotin operon repressor/biotin-[acetyl-CoA-carboxylase] ligase [Sphingobium sp. B2D3A]MCW2385006.1 BirA family biotin operon repressor/biotin-[acetyl-CoA-carboxylase] ligase [Sphingobium sp. B2D3D]
MPRERIHVVPETGSTNADLRAQADGWPDGHWLRAERQTGGRGRLGREWHSPTGNLYASTLIALRPDDPPVTGISLMMGIAVHDALASLAGAAPILLKWPNDLLADGAKLAGMLLEREGRAIIAGVGINITSAPLLTDRATVALNALPGGASVTAETVLDALVLAVDRWLLFWRAEGMAGLVPAWLARAHPLGTPLVVTGTADAPLHGRFAGLRGDGALMLACEDGSQAVVHSGDVGILP